MKRSRVRLETNAAGEAEISIFGEIGFSWFEEGNTLDSVKEAFDQVKDAPKIRLLLNSPGGDAFEGMAIYNLLAKARDRLTVEVLGLAASAASVIALAGHELVMDEGSYFMIHEPWGITIGPADDHRKTADLLDKMSGNFADVYAAHSGLSRDEALDAMKQETWYTAAEAMEAGFATEIGESADVAAVSIDTVRFQYKHTPNGLGKTAASSDRKPPRTASGLEQLLRESGYSRSDATGIAARGAKALLPERESREEPEAAGPASSESERQAEDEDLELRSRSQETAIAISNGRKS